MEIDLLCRYCVEGFCAEMVELLVHREAEFVHEGVDAFVESVDDVADDEEMRIVEVK